MTNGSHWETPRVSVLLPVRNGQRTLPAALRSVQRQEGVSWECICVDDNSTDGTWQLLQQFACADPRFRVFPSPGKGIVAALQFGLAHCRGALVARMDADDAMHPQRLLRQAQALDAEPSLAGVGCRVRAFPAPHIRLGFRRYVRWLDGLETPELVARERFIECPVLHPTMMFRRSTLERHAYRDTVWPEDYDLILRLLESGEKLANLPQRLHFWRVHASKASLTDARYSQQQFARCKAYYLARGPLHPCDRYVLWGYGPTARRLCRALRHEGKEPYAIVEVHPRRIGLTIRGAPVVPPQALSSLPQLPLLVSVAHPTARTLIRQYMGHTDRVEGRDWFFTA